MGARAAARDEGASAHARARISNGRDDAARRFHEAWLGYVQPREGLVFSVPVLADADCHERQPSTIQAELALLCRTIPATEADRQAGLHVDREGGRRLADVEALLTQILEYAPEDFDRGEALPADLHLYVPEGPQDLRPSLGLRRRGGSPETSRDGLIPDASTPASRAGVGYLMLVCQLRDGLAFDRVETETGPWPAPPDTKLDRLLRACRVPIGLLANGDEVRLIYAPHGGASGSVTFRLADMVGAGSDARHIVDAFKNLLSAPRFFAVAPDRQLPALLRASRERQADVTKALAGQVLDALGILVAGLERAAERGDAAWLDELLARAKASGDNTIYEGLLTVLLRLVFCLYAEDKGLLPVESEVYETDYSVHALFNQLQEDHATHPDTMDRRFGAWARLLSLFRAIHGGACHADLDIPARHGDVFDPRRFPFLEDAGGRIPAIDDQTVYNVLEELIILEGQRLSYRALDVEQLGSVYEGLMGFRVERLSGPAVCLRGNRVWVVAKEVLARPASERGGHLEDEAGVEMSVLKKVAADVKAARTEAEMIAALEAQQAGRTGRAGKGRLVVQPGPERRRTSSHYTPRELTERVVNRALEPLLGAMGGAPSSERLLNLKICDPAMGSGAFLVAACRFLAEQLVAAWAREGKQAEVGNGREDALLRAKRLVAQRCLYGVDKNPLAVNLAKLSLWLETMAREEPFTFVDHALKHGDSLVGLTLDQIRAFDWKAGEGKQLELPFAAEIDEALTDALHRRQRILDLARQVDVTSEEKRALLRDAEDALVRARLIADLLVGAWFSAETDKDRETERLRRLNQIPAWLREGGECPAELQALVTDERVRISPFHWMLELPEIFFAEREDPLDEGQRNRVAWMDAFVGNPPFMGGRIISGTHGDNYAAWLENVYAASKNADLGAHFFRRAVELLGEHGTIGLVATKTIAQGDTRQSGLQRIIGEGGVIYDAIRNMPWPGEAAVSISLVHIAKGHLREKPRLTKRLDGCEVAHINSRLLGSQERPDPRPLRANAGLCYIGSYVLGMGFVLTPEERKDLIRKNPANAKLILPYLGGEELNTSPTQSFDRYVINFGDMSLKDAEQWPDLIRIVREKVKPERDRVNRAAHRKYWWHYADKRPALNVALSHATNCLVAAIVTKHICFSFQPTNRVFSHKVAVFPSSDMAKFGVLQSRVHEEWAWLLSSTMRGAGINYSPSDCLMTFPFPGGTSEGSTLARVGKVLTEGRAKVMVERNQGLTATYNQLKDPDNRDPTIVTLRRHHEDMDRAVLEAYGWSEIGVPPFETPVTPEQKAAFERFSSAVIDRLFALNAERAAAEEQGPPASSIATSLRRGPKRAPPIDKKTSDRIPPKSPVSKPRKAS